MNTHKLLICAVAIPAAFGAVKARAQNLTATLSTVSPALTVNGTIDSGVVSGHTSGVLGFTNFDSFCAEPSQSISYGETLVFEVQDAALLANSDTISRLVGGYLASARTNEDAAAVQWAIWETVVDGVAAPSFSNGIITIVGDTSQATAALASQYLANVASYSPASLTYLTNSTRQDQVSWNAAAAVPEPSSAGLASLASLLLLRRRRP